MQDSDRIRYSFWGPVSAKNDDVQKFATLWDTLGPLVALGAFGFLFYEGFGKQIARGARDWGDRAAVFFIILIGAVILYLFVRVVFHIGWHGIVINRTKRTVSMPVTPQLIAKLIPGQYPLMRCTIPLDGIEHVSVQTDYRWAWNKQDGGHWVPRHFATFSGSFGRVQLYYSDIGTLRSAVSAIESA